jgi:hypothetical protein
VDREEFPKTVIGKIIYGECTAGTRGLTGLKSGVSDYNGKVRSVVWVRPAANLTVEGLAPAANGTQPPAQHQRPPQGQTPPPSQGAATSTSTSPTAGDPVQVEIKAFNRRLAKAAAAYKRCACAVAKDLVPALQEIFKGVGGFQPSTPI